MDIGTLCNRNVIMVRELDELTLAARLMREKHIGFLVVVKPNIADGTFSPVGVLTERDIVVAVVAKEADPRSLTVGMRLPLQITFRHTEPSAALGSRIRGLAARLDRF